MVYQRRLLFDSLVNQTMWWGVPVWIISHKATRIIPYNVTQQCHGGGGGLHWKSRVQEYSSYTQRDSPTVKKFSLVDTFSIAYSDNAGHTNNWCRLTVILWIKKTQKHKQRSHDKQFSSNKPIQSLPDHGKSSTNTSYTVSTKPGSWLTALHLPDSHVRCSGIRKDGGDHTGLPV